jgi:hypothetical protein
LRSSGASVSSGPREHWPPAPIPANTTVGYVAVAVAEHHQAVFEFLSQIQSDPGLRAQLNEVCTADEVSAIAAARGVSFPAAALLELFERCNEAPIARSGLMDEKLIRVYLRRESLL